MNAGEIDNDTRGWIMCLVSAIACMVGASVITIDIFIRLIPSKRNFRIDESHAFQSLSYGFSFGVLMFSALYSILPSSKKYLIMAEFSPKSAAWILLGGFVAGFIAIGILSRIVHSHTESKEIGCTHNHDGKESQAHSRAASHASRSRNRRPSSRSMISNGRATESTPLMQNGTTRKESPHVTTGFFGADGAGHSRIRNGEARQNGKSKIERRPSMVEVRDRVMSFVKDTKTSCDSSGPCYGYTGLCGQQCFKGIPVKTPGGSHRPSVLRHNTTDYSSNVAEELGAEDPHHLCKHLASTDSPPQTNSSTVVTRATSAEILEVLEESEDEFEEIIDHHHHIPENPYTDISFQTSIAIALHKLPEGFMTYATNHANPDLGFSVFMALFVHNITEGFALALPIYLASRSRVKALLVTALIGGAAQPLGAGIAALWFKIAGEGGHTPGQAAYGVMFAITAGVMTSVALMLFKEGMEFGHHREACIYFAFMGMTIMAMSNALTS